MVTVHSILCVWCHPLGLHVPPQCSPAMSPQSSSSPQTRSPCPGPACGPSMSEQVASPCPCPTFVVVPDADAPDAAQAALRGDLEHVQAVTVEGVVPIQVSVATFIVHPVQGNAHVGCGTCREGRGSLREAHLRGSCSPALPVTALNTNPAPEEKPDLVPAHCWERFRTK